MDDARLTGALASAADTARAARFHVDATDSPIEKAQAWLVYRQAVGLRKALETWIETRGSRKTMLAES